jgi:hypothetical protein
MAIDVTVLGASGTTVTIPFTSVDSAAAAQAALAGISNLVLGGVLDQVNYTGGGTLPGIAAPATQGGVLALGTATTSAVFGLSGNYVSAVLGGATAQPIIVGFGQNSNIVAVSAGGSTVSSGATVGGGASQGAVVGNLGQNTQVFFGGAGIQSFAELGLGAIGGGSNPSATVWVTTPLKGTASFDDSSGSTTINLDTVASTLSTAHPFGQTLIITNSGDGDTTVNIHSASTSVVTDGNVISIRETSTVAATVNAAGGANSLGVATGGLESWMLMKSGNVFINGNGSEIILLPTTATAGSATLFGGSGTDLDSGVAGLIQGGSAGNNVLFGSTVAGSTTLMGGGSGDVLAAQSSGNLHLTGKGSEQMYGNGSGAGNTFAEGVVNTATGSGANTAIVGLFVEGKDTVSLDNPASGTYSLVGNTTVAPTAGQVAFQYVGANTQVSFGDGTTWTVLSVHLTNSDFH